MEFRYKNHHFPFLSSLLSWIRVHLDFTITPKICHLSTYIIGIKFSVLWFFYTIFPVDSLVGVMDCETWITETSCESLTAQLYYPFTQVPWSSVLLLVNYSFNRMLCLVFQFMWNFCFTHCSKLFWAFPLNHSSWVAWFFLWRWRSRKLLYRFEQAHL